MTFWSTRLSRLSPFYGVAFAVVSTCLFSASQAEARPENLRWTHSRPGDIQRFEARVSAIDGSTSQLFDLGVPSADTNGIYELPVEAGDVDVRIEVRAYGPGQVISPWTPPQLRLAPTGVGGSAGGGGGGGGGTGGGDGTVAVGAGTSAQPIAGAASRFDFTGNAVGSSNTPWFDTNSNYSLVENDTLFDVVQLGSNRVLHTDSTNDAIHSHTQGPENIWTNFVLHGRMAADHADASIGVTTYSQYPGTDRYYRLANDSGGSFRLEGRPALNCSNTDTGVVPTAGTWYRFELDVVDRGTSNQVRARIWREGDSEPSAFQVDCDDSSSDRPRQGTMGVYAGGTGQKYWDDLEVVVATVVESPPPEPPVLIQVVPAVP